MIQMEEVGKHYGDTRALGPVTFEIPEGKAVGFLGLNGVGKTTLLRILACDLRPTSGRARVAGTDVLEDPHAVRALVGYLPESPPLYRDMTVFDYLAFAARIKGVDRSAVESRVDKVLERTALRAKRHARIDSLSHGYRQRVGLAQALVHDPAVLILDEPTNGLDPVQISEMRDLICALRGSCTILISSHILTEISETCDEILVLHDGEIIESGTEESLSTRVLRSSDTTVAVRAGGASDPGAVIALLERIDGVTRVERAEGGPELLAFRVSAVGDVRAEVCRTLVQAGHDVLRLDRAPRELERVFVRLVGGASA